MTTTTTTYRHCRTYALVIAVDPDQEDAEAAIGFLQTLLELTNGYTPYDATIDDQYDDACGPDLEIMT